MANYIENGTYRASGVTASVYRNGNGNVILCTEWHIAQLNKNIRNWDCVINASGEIRERTFNDIKKWATGWDGTSFAWFTANIHTCEVELVVENQPTNPPEYDEAGNPRLVSRVKWINPVGGGRNVELKADESAEIDRLFSARLRANAGARPVGGVAKPAGGVPKPAGKAAPPAVPPTPAKTPPKPARKAAGASAVPPPVTNVPTQESVWEHFCAVAEGAGLTAESRNNVWARLVSEVNTADYAVWMPADWQKLSGLIDDWDGVPF